MALKTNDYYINNHGSSSSIINARFFDKKLVFDYFLVLGPGACKKSGPGVNSDIISKELIKIN